MDLLDLTDAELVALARDYITRREAAHLGTIIFHAKDGVSESELIARSDLDAQHVHLWLQLLHLAQGVELVDGTYRLTRAGAHYLERHLTAADRPR